MWVRFRASSRRAPAFAQQDARHLRRVEGGQTLSRVNISAFLPWRLLPSYKIRQNPRALREITGARNTVIAAMIMAPRI